MVEIGAIFLAIGWLAAFSASTWGAGSLLKGKGNHVEVARGLSSSLKGLLVVCCVGTLASLFCLGLGFYQSDFRFLYIWQHSSPRMPGAYRVAALWGGMDGSMLLWAGIQALFILRFAVSNRVERLRVHAYTVLASSMLFFLTICLFLTNPFSLIPGDVVPTDGVGLNPLLQNPSMLIHPPLLYGRLYGSINPLCGRLCGCYFRCSRYGLD